MIDLSRYRLTDQERRGIDELLREVGNEPTLEQIWQLMDRAWQGCGCSNRLPDADRYAAFYRHPVWLLNGIFIEQHELSMAHRQAIAAAVAGLNPGVVVDFGGGFGTLARLLAQAVPTAEILICEPFPPQHGTASCAGFETIRFVPELVPQSADVLVCTDVLEHVPDPLALLSAMVGAVRPGGHLLIANCFYPVIECHLPGTFHLRYSFDRFCRALGLQVIGPCQGSHATLYRRVRAEPPDWPKLRQLEQRSQRLFPWRQWRSRTFSPWRHRLHLAIAEPSHYPRKLWHLLERKQPGAR